jgi:hypothetical protein
MNTSSYRPPSIFEDDLIPQAVREIRVSLLSKASEVLANAGLNGWMFLGGGYDLFWRVSERVVHSFGCRYGTKSSLVRATSSTPTRIYLNAIPLDHHCNRVHGSHDSSFPNRTLHRQVYTNHTQRHPSKQTIHPINHFNQNISHNTRTWRST